MIKLINMRTADVKLKMRQMQDHKEVTPLGKVITKICSEKPSFHSSRVNKLIPTTAGG